MSAFSLVSMLAFNQKGECMKRCKECKGIISVSFSDMVNGEMPMPEKKYSNKKLGVCDECARRLLGVKQS